MPRSQNSPSSIVAATEVPFGLQKRSVSIDGHKTSLALEAEFWTALEAIAKSRAVSIGVLIATIDQARAQHHPDRPLASAARVFALRHASMPASDPDTP